MLKVALMPAPPIQSLTLTDFRSYAAASLDLSGGSVFLFGPNGAGKTNVLEAVSWLAPGRGLRGAPALEAGRRMPGETVGRAVTRRRPFARRGGGGSSSAAGAAARSK